MPNLGVGLTLFEVSYDEADKSENTIDLLDTSSTSFPPIISSKYLKAERVPAATDSNMASLTAVTVRSQHELEKVLRSGLRKSNNWLERKEYNSIGLAKPTNA